MNRRTVAVAVSMICASGMLLAACSTETDASADGGDASTSLLAPNGVPEQLVVDLFNESEPDISVDVQNAPGTTYAEVVTTQLAGGTAADIIRTYPGNGSTLSVVQATNNGFLEPLDGMDFIDELNESELGVLTSEDGQVMAVPMTTTAIGGVYNTTVTDELGLTIPTTWSEVLTFCEEAVAAGRVPYGLGLRDAWTGQFVSYALSATLLPPDIVEAQAASDQPFSGTAWSEVIGKYDEMRQAGCFTAQPNGTSAANVNSSIAAGDTVATIGLADSVGAILDESPSGTEITFAVFPATDDADETRLSNGIGAVFSLNSAAEDPEAAKQFLEFLATPEAQSLYSAETDQSPAMTPSDDYEPDQPTEVITEYVQADRASSWPDQTWPNPAIQQAHFEEIQALFADQSTVDDVLAALDAAYVN
ncbi:ABC transporter substrate-binding protein [Ruania alba]|uniref:Raffinose/stachyose/melibiose transport system substrate-binding protein n=1 Tax=Ruania alba TaxID=648782 RepID=A0A1H5L0B6_9MICO|nr:extracellular solute-binding protein [Ruania alba]SEE70057.1 raffinose/stachyose/melibiose transport system substrate-binding protein [Ruania alba]